MPSASNNNQSSTKLVKQTSVNSMSSGGPSGTSGVEAPGAGCSGKGLHENLTETSPIKSNNDTATAAPLASSAASSSTTNGSASNGETASINSTAKDNASNGVAAATAAAAQNGKNWETNSTTGNSNAAAGAGNGNGKEAASDAWNPMKLTFTTIEHKIRNLEKRKTKLEGYRAIAATGRELSADQKAAVQKYDAVLATLDFARDLVKQMQQFVKDAEKEQKKQARKELIAKAQAETVKIREVLILQNILSCLTDDSVRSDFLSGEQGAAKLETAEFEILDKFCWDVQTRRPETSDDVPFAVSAQKAAEIFSMTIDARPKAYGDTTYENVKRIFHRIQESNYLDRIYLTDVPDPDAAKEEPCLNAESGSNDLEDGGSGLTGGDAQQMTNDQEDSADLDDVLEDGVEKLSIVDNGVTPLASNDVSDSMLMAVGQHLPQHQQQQPLADHMEMAQRQQQTQLGANGNAGQQPLMPAPMAPPASAVPAFQPTNPAPAHSGATTPVHVDMYGHPNLPGQAGQQLQQISVGVGPPQGSQTQIVVNMPPPPQAQGASAAGAPNQQRQIMGSPANVPVPVGGMVTPMQQGPPPPGIFNPTPVHAVEQGFFKQHPQQQQQHQQHQLQQHQQYLQQMRPLADVIGGGNFYFLQDSELDSPELNAQGQPGPQTTLIFEQQQQQQQSHQSQGQSVPPSQQQQSSTQQQLLQNLQQQKTSPNIMPDHNSQIMTNGVAAGAIATNMPPQTQQQQHLQPNLNQTTTIQTQTFTNQSFPQIQPGQQQQAQPSNAPSPLFHHHPQQQQQQQPQPTHAQKQSQQQQQMFSPVQGQQQPASQLMMPGAVDAQQPAMMLINRLGTAGSAQSPLMQQQQLQQHQHQQLQQTPQQQNLLQQQQQQQQQANPSPQNTVTNMHPIPSNPQNPSELNQALKSAAYHFDNSVGGTRNYERTQTMTNILNKCLEEVRKCTPGIEADNMESNQWSTTNKLEVNANSPLTEQQQTPQTQRKSDWNNTDGTGPASTNSSAGGVNTGSVVDSYATDSRSTEPANHWHSQESQGGYNRNPGNRQGQQGGALSGTQGNGGYQRRNDDRRGGDDRRPGGNQGQGGGGYRGRSHYNSGPQQNGNSRGGSNSSGIYFRNNENNNSSSYYQNGGGGNNSGSVYASKEGGSRYDSGGPGQYRGPRTAGSNAGNGRSNGPPPRHMGGRASGGQPNSNTNSNTYMNSRQTSNRMALGLESKH